MVIKLYWPGSKIKKEILFLVSKIKVSLNKNLEWRPNQKSSDVINTKWSSTNVMKFHNKLKSPLTNSTISVFIS